MQRMRVVAGTLAAEEKRGAGHGSCPFSSLFLPESHTVDLGDGDGGEGRESRFVKVYDRDYFQKLN